MEQQKQHFCYDSIIYDGFPPISSKHPWLVDHNSDAEGDDQFFYNLNDPLSNYHCRIPELLRKRIRGCFHGWLILSDHPHNNLTLSLWNPNTPKIICLPPLILKDGDYESFGECCLSSPPDDLNSILLLTRTNKPSFVFIRLHCKRKKLEKWIEMSYDKQLKRITGQDGLLVHSLASCNGKVYALNTDNGFTSFIIKFDILVKDREVLIKLSLLGPIPFSFFGNCSDLIFYLKGSGTELFFISVEFLDKTQKTPGYVSMFKLDMSSIKREEMEVFKNLDMTDKDWKKMEDFSDLHMTRKMWKEMKDLEGAIFFVDVAHDVSVYYSSTIASELGGYIHIRGKTGKIIYSYNVKKKTISVSSMPFQVMPTSNVFLWECRLEDGHGEPKCSIDSNKEEEDNDREIVVISVKDQEVESNESHLLNLPFPILEMIMELCVGVEYMKFRATCKLCHLAAPSMQWSDSPALTRLQNCSLVSPWLMVVDINQGILTFTDPICGGNYFLKNSHISIIDGRIYCSRFGWLLFLSSDLKCPVFFNPFTNDLHKLPHPNCYFNTVCFSAPPTSSDCMVVGFPNIPVGHVLIHFVACESSWRALSLGSDPISSRFPTFIGRDIYALCKEGKLNVIKNLGEEDYSWKRFEAEAQRSSCRSLAQYFLMKCDQHILLVVVGECGESVEVFKWNNSTKEWEKIEGLGKHVIFICGTTCICIEAKIPEMENKIYFPRSHTKNEKMVFYSLETCRYHTFNGKIIEENFGDFIGTDYHVNTHAWIEPSWF